MRRCPWVLIAVALLPLSACASAAAEETALFDGKALGQWKIVDNFDFRNHGKVAVKDGAIVLEKGNPGTAVRFAGKMPKTNYEVSLDARRVEGDDFFCGLTFPVGDKWLSLIVGGWGGRVVGLSCIDDEPAAENETCNHKEFKENQWYAIRLRVTPEKVQAWIDKEPFVDLPLKDRKLTIWFEPESVTPLGIATWRTTGAVRNIRLTTLDAKTPARAEQPAGPGGGKPAKTENSAERPFVAANHRPTDARSVVAFTV